MGRLARIVKLQASLTQELQHTCPKCFIGQGGAIFVATAG